MRCILPLCLILSAGLPVFGQSRSYDRPYGDRAYAREDRSVFDRVRIDLDHASGYAYASRDDRKRFDEARRELFDFESRFDRGDYQKHELDQAIDRIQRVVDRNSLDPRDRGALADDLRLMRDYRSFRDHNPQRFERVY